MEKHKVELIREKVPNVQKHYDNSRGSLYQIALDRGWNSYQFDLVKRIDRIERKGLFEEDIKKTKDLLEIYRIERTIRLGNE